MQELSGSPLSREEPLDDDFSFEYSSPRKTLSSPLAPDDDSSLDDDFSFEYSSIRKTLSSPLTPDDDSSLDNDFSEDDWPNEEDKDDWSDEEEDVESVPIRQSIKSSLRAAVAWCDEITNSQDDFLTNLKSHLPFVVIVGIIILALWALRIFYG